MLKSLLLLLIGYIFGVAFTLWLFSEEIWDKNKFDYENQFFSDSKCRHVPSANYPPPPAHQSSKEASD